MGQTNSGVTAGTRLKSGVAGVESRRNPANSYCVFIDDPAGASPTVILFNQVTSSGSWLASTITVTASAIVVVPEPSTWALMLIGFGGVGWLAYRRRRATAPAA